MQVQVQVQVQGITRLCIARDPETRSGVFVGGVSWLGRKDGGRAPHYGGALPTDCASTVPRNTDAGARRGRGVR